MKKTEHSHYHGGGGSKSELLSSEDDLLIRPFKKLKVSRLGKATEEKDNHNHGVHHHHHHLWSVSSGGKTQQTWGLDHTAAPDQPSGSCSLRFRPSRLTSSSVQINSRNDSTAAQDEEEEEEEEEISSSQSLSCPSWRRSNGAKDFSSHIIRRFDTISLSGGKRKKKSRCSGAPEGAEEEGRLEAGGSKTVNCATQARQSYNDVSVDDLAGYLENSMVFPKKMSYMAEMMYT